jgi:hypothetical protein
MPLAAPGLPSSNRRAVTTQIQPVIHPRGVVEVTVKAIDRLARATFITSMEAKMVAVDFPSLQHGHMNAQGAWTLRAEARQSEHVLAFPTGPFVDEKSSYTLTGLAISFRKMR